MIGYSDFYVPINASVTVNNGDKAVKLGQITLTLSPLPGGASPRDPLPKCNRFYVYVNKDSTDLLVYYEVLELAPSKSQHSSNGHVTSNRLVTYYNATTTQCDAALWQAFRQKTLCLVMDRYSTDTCCMDISVSIVTPSD